MQSAASSLFTHLAPLIHGAFLLAGIAAAGFLVYGAIILMGSSGRPEKLARGKRIITRALIGLVVVLASVTLTSILTKSYASARPTTAHSLPVVTPVQVNPDSAGLATVLVDAMTGLFQTIVTSVAKPFVAALSFFTDSTPLLASNPSVLVLWTIIVGIADTLFIVVVILLGFHIMSATALGIEEVEFKHLLPRLVIIFILMNSSLFIIDGLIGVSNVMIIALKAGVKTENIWQSIGTISTIVATLPLAGLLLFMTFVILAVVLLVYYIVRLVVLYVGAVTSPLILLLSLLPGFRDFAINSLKSYVVTIFVLFVHVVILILSASLIVGASNSTSGLNPIMGLLVGCATVLALLKTQSALSSLAIASSGARSARRLSGDFMNGIHSLTAKPTPRVPHSANRLQSESFFKGGK